MRTSSRTGTVLLSIVAICGTIAYFSDIIQSPADNQQSSSTNHLRDFSSHSNNDNTNRRRRLSNSLPNGGCEITWPKKPDPGTQITYAASYPGCGARMTWNLVEALTGLETGDDWNNNGRGEEVITVKTHYPQSNGILVEFDEKIQRGFIVVRNPMKSIPSFFNHIFEMRNHLPVHSERAPVEEWVKWRNAYLDTEIAEYKKFIFYWMDRYTPANRLLITYEGLTDNVIGPEVTKSLNEFLGKAQGVTPIAQESVACIWRAVVKNEPPAQQAEKFKKLQSQAVNAAGPNQGMAQPGAAAVPQQPQAAAVAAIPQQPPAMPMQGQQAPVQPVQQPLQTGFAVPPPPGYGQAPDLQSQIAAAQNALAEGQQLIAQTQPQQQTQPGLRRRLDPGHHNSQRAGPVQPRPYLPAELDKILAMLMEVADKYKDAGDDARVYHIMMKYYEEVRAAREMLSGGEAPVAPPGGFF